MSMATAQFLVSALATYLACGVIFAAVFLWRWVGRLDPLAEHGTVGFRALVFPGVTALWPIFVMRLIRGANQPADERTAHRSLGRLEIVGESAEVRR
jgi:hypothetical protein